MFMGWRDVRSKVYILRMDRFLALVNFQHQDAGPHGCLDMDNIRGLVCGRQSRSGIMIYPFILDNVNRSAPFPRIRKN